MSDTALYYKVRLLYSKTGPAAYISHLDLMKALQRAFRRAGLKVRYSQGFNPHICLSILSPLSTGFQSLGDVCDFELLSPPDYDDIVLGLNRTLPPGLQAIKAGEPGKKPADIAYSRFRIEYPAAGEAKKMAALFAGPLEVEKRSKRGSKVVRMGDYILRICFESIGDSVVCDAVLKAGDDPLNPVYITAALLQNGIIGSGCVPKYTRAAILDGKGEIFF